MTGQRTDAGLDGAVVGNTGSNTGGDAPLGMASGTASGTAPGTAPGTASLAATYVRALLERAGIPRHRHSAHIATLLQLSYHQAHRRMAGGAPWSLEELQAVVRLAVAFWDAETDVTDEQVEYARSLLASNDGS